MADNKYRITVYRQPAENTAELSRPIKHRNSGHVHATFLREIELCFI